MNTAEELAFIEADIERTREHDEAIRASLYALPPDAPHVPLDEQRALAAQIADGIYGPGGEQGELRLMPASTIAEPVGIDAWRIHDLIRPAMLGVWASQEGTGKTQAELEACIRLATGLGRLFGYYEIPEAVTVALVDEENGEAELWRREEQIRAALGLERADLARFHRVSFAGVHLARRERQDWLLDQLRRVRPAVVFLDTGGVMVDDEWGSSFKDAIRFLRAVIAEVGCAILVLVHLGKPPKDRGTARGHEHGTSLADVMGQWTRHVDMVAMLSDLGAGRVRFTVRKRVPPSSLVLARRDGLFDVVAIAEDHDRTTVDDRIIRAIAAGATSADEIRTALGTVDRPLPKRTFYDALARLRRDGFVEDGTPLRLTADGDEAAA